MRRRKRQPITTFESEGDVSLEDHRRKQLLDATIACIADYGLAKTTMRMVADRAGVTTGMVIYYYKNKKELLDSAIEAAYDVEKARLDSMSHSTYGLERLLNVLRAALMDADGSIARRVGLQLRKEALTDEDARRAYLAQVQYGREHIARSIRTAQQHGEVRLDADSTMVTDLIWCLMQGLATEEVLSAEYLPADRAFSVGLLLFNLLAEKNRNLTVSDAESGFLGTGIAAPVIDPPQAVEALLMADPSLPADKAEDLAAVFRTLYERASPAALRQQPFTSSR